MKSRRSREILFTCLVIIFAFCLLAYAAPAQNLQVTKTPGENVQIAWDYPLTSGFAGFAFARGYTPTPDSSWTLWTTVPNPKARTFTFQAEDRTAYYMLAAYKQNPTPQDASAPSPVIMVNCTPLTRRILFWVVTVKPCQ